MSDRVAGFVVLAALVMAVVGVAVIAGPGWALVAAAASMVLVAVVGRDRKAAS